VGNKFIIEQSLGKRWVHGKNDNDWHWTNCDGNETKAEPGKEYTILKLLKAVDKL